MKLWFENRYEEERVIKDPCDTWAEVNQAIDEFIQRCNINKTNARKQYYGDAYDPTKDHPFVRYYTRIWEQADGRTRLDVGSWSEFFIWEGKFADLPHNTEGEDIDD